MSDIAAILDGWLAGEISGEVALMRLALRPGGGAALAAARDPALSPLQSLAAAHRDGLDKIGSLVAQGLVDLPAEGDRLALIRDHFDRAVALSPATAVALYSLGSPEILDRATREIVARLGAWRLLGPDRAVLDIGCGIGRIEEALAPYVGAIVGVEVAPGMLAEARRRCRGLAKVGFVRTDGRRLAAFADGTFDLVLAVDSFPYLVAADPAIAAAHVADSARLLRPGGALAILNYSYRGDLAADRADLARLAAANGLALRHAGTCDFTLWDAAGFLLCR
jgi:SAM-dependent methyltransferase